jgi:MATE family multidrug resistance protein
MALPLVLSTGAWSIQHFVNRMFLTWYSPEAVAASMPAGMVNFAIMSLFLGTVSYVDVFTAQYYGASRRRMIGPVIWQGIYLSLLGGVILLALVPFAGPVFTLIGHEAAIRHNETVYFQYLCYGAFPSLAAASMSAFYAGRGKTWTLVLANGIGTFSNILFDYLLIFGNAGFPEMGIRGAGLATVISSAITFFLYLALISRKRYNEEYATLQGWKPSWTIMRRILRYGFPSGTHMFMDIAGFTMFVLIMGSLGIVNLAATNIAFNISTLAFMPMIGGGIAVSVLVGQYLGRDRADLARRSVYSGFFLAFTYMALVSLSYVLLPELFLAPYAANADPAGFAPIRGIVVVLLRFVAVYSLFDAMNIIFSSAVKGAGDTHFVMKTIVVASVAVLIIPSYVSLVILKAGIYTGWTIASAYAAVLGLSFLFRFLQGKWQTMRVIEPSVPFVPPSFPEVPSEEL